MIYALRRLLVKVGKSQLIWLLVQVEENSIIKLLVKVGKSLLEISILKKSMIKLFEWE